ncbi:hypothetical protein C8J56DRAFT_1006244 [Mycena floridula]|nr:hypothetical protein C8J56DRAFT_1006244 [Mycena floridula]
MNEPASPYNASQSSPGGGSGIQKTDFAQSTRPLTIAQLNRATQVHSDAEWRLDSIELGHVRIVGQIMSITKQATNTSYIIDDSFGRFEVRHWASGDGDEDGKWAGIKETQYVRVTGGLKSFSNKRYINATSIIPCADMHEPYYHILDVIVTTGIIEKGPPGSVVANTPQSNLAGSSGFQNQPNSNNSHGQSRWTHFPPLPRKILEVIEGETPNAPEGVHVGAIARSMGGEDALKLSNALEKLMDDGLIYTTIDDSHFLLS